MGVLVEVDSKLVMANDTLFLVRDEKHTISWECDEVKRESRSIQTRLILHRQSIHVSAVPIIIAVVALFFFFRIRGISSSSSQRNQRC